MSEKTVRSNQKHRTRKDLLRAAARLLKEGRTPSLEEIAEAALVSRATAYRYFPGVEALLLEASFDVETPEPEAVFPPGTPDDPVERLVLGGQHEDRQVQRGAQPPADGEAVLSRQHEV